MFKYPLNESISWDVLYLLMIFTNSMPYCFFHSPWTKSLYFFFFDLCIESFDEAHFHNCRLVVKFDYSKLYLWFYFVQLILQVVYNKWLFYWWFIYKWLTWSLFVKKAPIYKNGFSFHLDCTIVHLIIYIYLYSWHSIYEKNMEFSSDVYLSLKWKCPHFFGILQAQLILENNLFTYFP